MAILSSIATFHTPGLRLPASGDLQLFSSSHPFERYEMEFKHKFGFERDLEPENEVNMPLRSVLSWIIEFKYYQTIRMLLFELFK
mgnify:FL=1